MITIRSNELSATINPHGAELTSLKTQDGAEWMSDGDPAFWTGRAPLLFPIVGRLAGDSYRVDGETYALPQHGFARRKAFTLVREGAEQALFRLVADEETMAVYPFRFTLDVAFTLIGATLRIDITVTNDDDRDMPASFGFHPAFAWPLPGGGAAADHRILFEKDEPGALTALAPGGGLSPEPRPSPVKGRELLLGDADFSRDALIWQGLQSRALRYENAQGPAIDIAFDADMLGLWTKPGARFLCIEPWYGIADPVGFTGEIWDKPGMLRFTPGQSRHFSMQVTLRK